MKLKLLAASAVIALASGSANAATGGGYIMDVTNLSSVTLNLGGAGGVGSVPVGGSSSLLAPLPSFGTFDIVVNGLGSMTAVQQQAFTDAEAFWEATFSGYRSAVLAAAIPALVIDASIVAIDGVGGVLGQAGATNAQGDGSFVTPDAGIMQFDSADVANLIGNGSFDDVILHEMGHVMGFSNTVWQLNPTGITSGADTTYTGARGLAAYQAEFNAGETSIPVEGDFGPGTAFSHWDEDLFFDHLATNGNSANPEIMTGFLDALPPTISQTTIYSYEDIGYVVNDQSAPPVPVPAAAPLLAVAIGGLMLVRRRAK